MCCLKVLHKRVPCGEAELSLFLTAVENTWVHARQKRREQHRHLRELPRAQPDAPEPSTEEPPTESSADPQHSNGKETSEKCADVPMESPTEQKEAPISCPSNPEAVQQFLFKCLVNVKVEDSDVVVEMHWVEGQSKDLMNQLCTFLKNSLFRQVANPT